MAWSTCRRAVPPMQVPGGARQIDSEHGRSSKRLKAALLFSPVTPWVRPAIAASTVSQPRSGVPWLRLRARGIGGERRAGSCGLEKERHAALTTLPPPSCLGGGGTADHRDHLRRAGRAGRGKSYAYYVHTNTHTTPHVLVILPCLRMQGPNILVPPIPSSSSSILPLPPSSSISLISISLPKGLQDHDDRLPSSLIAVILHPLPPSPPPLSLSLPLSFSFTSSPTLTSPHLSSPLRRPPPPPTSPIPPPPTTRLSRLIINFQLHHLPAALLYP